MFVDGVHATVAGGFQAQPHLVDIQLLADVQHQAGTQQEAGRRQAVEGSGDGHHQHAAFDSGQSVKGVDALGNDVLVRREEVVGQGFPIREVQYVQVRGEEAELLLQAFGGLAVGGQQQCEALAGAGRFGNGQAQGGTGQVAPVLFAGGGGQGREAQYGRGQGGLRSEK
ncbi:hypothetical protein D3C84_706060 [compost metagenome]